MSTHKHYYLVGLKGVAMTALAQLLLDAGQTVSGSDVSDNFVTAAILKKRGLVADSFDAGIADSVNQVVYTAAHQARLHPQVQAALQKGIPVQSHAEALADWFNQKKGIAVSGVGGKSTISAMLAWICTQAGMDPSFAVGVGTIIGMDKTGRWSETSEYIIAEADEYATDPIAVQQGADIIPRFHYLKPSISVTSTISFDHPDVYKNEAHTRQIFVDWFTQLPTSGILIAADSNRAWLEKADLPVSITWYGSNTASDFVLTSASTTANQQNTATFTALGETYSLTLQVPGTYNLHNALAAIAAADAAGVTISDSINYLAGFRSTLRRFEHVGTENGVELYDDYAHHPQEITAVLEAAHQWFAGKRVVVAFQPHTYSRTKALFDDFVAALAKAPELILLDIFASAREKFDPSISSDSLVAALKAANPQQHVSNLHTIDVLATYCRSELHAGDVLLTLGAGTIYQVHELLGASHE